MMKMVDKGKKKKKEKDCNKGKEMNLQIELVRTSIQTMAL